MQRDADMRVAAAVLVGVLQEVDYHARHKPRVEARLDSGLDVRGQFRIGARRRGALLAAGADKLAKIHPLHRVFIGAVLHTGQAEQLLHELRHVAALLFNYIQRY